MPRDKNDDSRQFAETFMQVVMEEVSRRDPRTDGMVSKSLAREVFLEFTNKLEAEYLKIPAQFTNDPVEQRRMAIEIDGAFNQVVDDAEKELGPLHEQR